MGDHAWVQDAVLGAERLHLALGEVGVHLDLVHRGHDRRVRRAARVRWSTMKLLTPMARTLPSASSVSSARYASQGLVEVRREGLVQDQQVDLVDAELAGALVEAVQGLVVAVVADPDLGLDEDLGAVDAGAARIASPTCRSLP